MSLRRQTKLANLFEKLEPRTLMHGDGGGFHADINFQPATAPAVPDYLIDSGLKFGDRGGGYFYGWNATNTANTRDRNSSASSSQLYDTLIHMQKSGSFGWQLAVPNGTYTVHLVAGDPTAIDSTYRINAEGVLLLDGKPTASKHWIEATGQVTVKDGLLSLTSASNAINNKINFIEVQGVDADPDHSAATVEVSTPDASASEKSLDSGKIRFTRSGSAAADLTINYFVTGTASPGSDYDSLPASVIIPAGSSSADVIIAPIDDAALESAESVLLQIRPGDYIVGKSKSGMVTIVDDEISDTEQPFFGTPQRFSATIQAEDFDLGANGVSYKDKTAGNASGSQNYRFSDVDIAPTTDMGGGFAVTHLQKDEYLKYTINVPIDATYRIETRIASTIASGSIFHISFDGKSTGSQTFTNTGGLEKWITLVKTTSLTAGVHVMKFVVDSSKTGGEVGSLNYIRVYRDLTATSGVSFKSVAPLPFAREEGQSATLNSQFYVFGGLYTDVHFLATARVDRYDSASNAWTRMADMPEAFTHAAVVVDGSTAWFIGAYVGNHPGPGTTHVWKYDSTTDTWTQGPDLPDPRGAGAGGLIERTLEDSTVVRELHFFGGRDFGRDTDEVDHWALDLDHPDLGWQTRAPLPSPRNHLSGAVIDNKLYAIAGEQLEEASSINQTEVDVYDPSTDTWNRVADMPLPLSHVHQSTVVLNGKIITMGGELVHNTSADQVLMYDPSLDMWSLIGKLPSPRRAMMAGVLDGKLIATGGYLNGKQYTNTWVSTVNL